MGNRKTRPEQRVVERSAVNATRTMFEGFGQIYHEISQANDYGKDAYIDLVEGDNLTGQVIALQVKGGKSYKSKSGHFIPYSEADWALWTDSSMPVFGVVHDPEIDLLFWVNLTETLCDVTAAKSGRVVVSKRLDKQTWEEFFSSALHESRRRGIGLLGLHSEDPIQQEAAAWDVLAVGRFDARAFIMLRRSLFYLSEHALLAAVHVLAHCIPFHPDIYWNQNNSVLDQVKATVCRHLDWSVDDAVAMLRIVDPEDMFTRGSIGEDVCLLLSEGWGPDVCNLFERTLSRAAAQRDEDIAYKAAIVLQYMTGDDANSTIEQLMNCYPELREMPLMNNLLAAVKYMAGWTSHRLSSVV